MPRFTQADEAFLKRTMLPRAPDYLFKPEDVELIMKETGKDKEHIHHWARQLRWKAGMNKLPGSMSIEEFLKASAESLDEKVMCSFAGFDSHVAHVT
jgi:predicted NUDIX family phosphoesterase